LNVAGGTMSGAFNNAPPVSIAAAATTNIGAAASNSVTITSGAGSITAFDTIAAGAVRTLTFSAGPAIVYNATSMILPTAATILANTGDTAQFVSLGSGNWQCLWYQRANGQALSSSASGTVTTVSVVTANGFAGTVATATSTPAITITTSISGMLKGSSSALVAATAGTDFVAPGTATTFSATQTFNGSSSTSAMKVTNVTELVDVVGAAPSATQTFYVASGAVQLYTTNAANNWIINFGWSSGTTMNAEMAVGDSITVTMLITQGSTAYYVTAVEIDGTTVGVNWQGGTAPTAGHASGIDAYNFSIIKTASATYTVLGSLTQF
jgi:hypothetical protein